MWDAILQHKERIQRERPEINQKIENIQKMTTQEAFAVDQGK